MRVWTRNIHGSLLVNPRGREQFPMVRLSDSLVGDRQGEGGSCQEEMCDFEGRLGVRRKSMLS